MKVLISSDNSAAGEHILQEAHKFLATFADVEIYVYSVIDLAVISATGHYNNDDEMKWLEEQAVKVKKAAERIFAGKEIHFSSEVGYPAQMIVQKATDIGADLLILGTHGKTGLNRILLGSVAENVLRHTLCKTLIIPVKHLKNG